MEECRELEDLIKKKDTVNIYDLYIERSSIYYNLVNPENDQPDSISQLLIPNASNIYTLLRPTVTEIVCITQLREPLEVVNNPRKRGGGALAGQLCTGTLTKIKQ